jgi:hypothetical protein
MDTSTFLNRSFTVTGQCLGQRRYIPANGEVGTPALPFAGIRHIPPSSYLSQYSDKPAGPRLFSGVPRGIPGRVMGGGRNILRKLKKIKLV